MSWGPTWQRILVIQEHARHIFWFLSLNHRSEVWCTRCDPTEESGGGCRSLARHHHTYTRVHLPLPHRTLRFILCEAIQRRPVDGDFQIYAYDLRLPFRNMAMATVQHCVLLTTYQLATAMPRMPISPGTAPSANRLGQDTDESGEVAVAGLLHTWEPDTHSITQVTTTPHVGIMWLVDGQCVYGLIH